MVGGYEVSEANEASRNCDTAPERLASQRLERRRTSASSCASLCGPTNVNTIFS